MLVAELVRSSRLGLTPNSGRAPHVPIVFSCAPQAKVAARVAAPVPTLANMKTHTFAKWLWLTPIYNQHRPCSWQANNFMCAPMLAGITLCRWGFQRGAPIGKCCSHPAQPWLASRTQQAQRPKLVTHNLCASMHSRSSNLCVRALLVCVCASMPPKSASTFGTHPILCDRV